MIVTCPQCGKQYKFPDEKVKAGGVKVKCKSCESVFQVGVDGATEARYTLVGPDGAVVGTFPLETVRARIEVGEVTREFSIAPEGGAPVAIHDFAPLSDVSWPEAASAPAAGGGDDFGFDDDLGASAAAPSAAAAGGGDDFGFDDDLGASAAAPSAAAAGGGDDFGFDDDFGAAAPAPAPAKPAAPAAAAAKPAAADDFNFDDFATEASAGSGAPAAPSGDDWGDAGTADDAGADPFATDAAPAAAAPAARAADDHDQLASLFDEDEGGAASLSEGQQGELDDNAFEFGEQGGEKAGDVFYEEDFDGAFEEEVERQVAAPAAPAGEAPAIETPAASDDDLITTLQQLSKKERPRRTPMILAIAGAVVAVGGLVAAVFFAPGVLRGVPGLGDMTLKVHEALGTEYHRQQILNEHFNKAMTAISKWTPRGVAEGLADLGRVATGDPTRVGAQQLGAQAMFFMAALARDPATVPGVTPKDPQAAAYLYAIGKHDVAPSGVDPALEQLVGAWHNAQSKKIDEALAGLTAPTTATPPLSMFLAVAAAQLYHDLGDTTNELLWWQRADEAAPENPWVALQRARALWAFAQRPGEVASLLDAIKDPEQSLTAKEQARYHELRARGAMANEDYRTALKAADMGLKAVPDDAPLLAVKGRIHLAERKWADANLVLDQAVVADGDLPEAVIALAQARAGIGRIDDAKTMLARSVVQAPTVREYRRAYIDLLMQQNELDRAEAEYSSAIAVIADDPQLIRVGADLALQRGDVVAAQERLRAYQLTNPNDPVVTLKLAEINLQRGELSQAETQLRQLLAIDASNIQTSIKLGEVLLLQKKSEEGLNILLDALSRETKNAQLYMLLGRAYIDLARLKEAREVLTESQKLSPNSWRVHLYNGEIYLLEGKYAEALIAMEKSLQLSNGATEVRLWLGRTYEESGRPGKAIEEYEKILSTEPDNLVAVRKLAAGKLAVDDWDGALPPLRKWQELAPREYEPYLYLGRVHVGKNDPAAAIDILTRGAARFGSNAEIRSELGWAYLKKQDYAKAEEQLKRAATLNSSDGRTQLRLGFYYKEKNRKADAQRAFQKAQRLGGLTEEEKLDAEQALAALAY